MHVRLTLSCTGWTLRIVGVPRAEPDAVLAFLYDHIAENYDFQLRYKWEPNDVAIWDNRASLPFFSYGEFRMNVTFAVYEGRNTLCHLGLLAL